MRVRFGHSPQYKKQYCNYISFRPIHMEIMVDRVAMRQISRRILRSPPVSNILPVLQTDILFTYHEHYIILVTDSVVR
jgi:hypothetical protein